MKKALVVLLILAVAGGVFAQELKLNGLVNSGMRLDKAEEKEWTASAYAYDAGQNFYRVNFQGAFTMENMGVNFRLRAQGNDNIFLPYAYGYVSILDKKILIKGGKVDDGAWNTKGDIDDDAGEGIGSLVQFMLIDGLNFGLGFYINGSDGWTNLTPQKDKNDVFQNPKGVTTGSDLDNAMYVVGAAYTMPDLFRLAVSAKIINSGSATDKDGDKGQGFQRLIGGLQILAVPNLTAVVEFVLDNQNNGVTGSLYNGDKDTAFELTEKIAYKIDNTLTIGITAYEFFNGILHTQDKHNPLRDNIGSLASGTKIANAMPFYKFGFYAEPWVSYALAEGKIVPKLGFKFAMHKFENDSPDFDASVMEIRIKPEVRFALASNSYIDLAYEFHDQFFGGDADKLDSVTFNRIYVDYVWKF